MSCKRRRKRSWVSLKMNQLNNVIRKKTRKRLFTTPSHGGKFFISHKFYQFYKSDLSETDAYNPQEALDASERGAAKIYGTNATKYLINGSTSGIIASVLACVERGDKVLIWENAHPCHKNAVELAGATPVYYSVPMIEGWGVPQEITSEIIEQGLKQGVKAVITTSPNYEGVTSDIEALLELCHRYGAYLIVDEAHGALYPFCDKLPQSSVNIADFTVQSLHKTAGGLNPTALLHTMTDLDISSALAKINTTSPSYPLLATIEANINFLNSKKGRKKILKLIELVEGLKSDCNNVEFFNGDSTKIILKKEGLTGYELSERLYELGIEDERANEKSVMLLTGLGTDYKKLEFLFKKLRRL